MERKKRVTFCITGTSTALDKGKDMQVRANNLAVRCRGEDCCWPLQQASMSSHIFRCSHQNHFNNHDPALVPQSTEQCLGEAL